MITQTARPFSELEARTEATAWEDRLLWANVLTAKTCPYSNIRDTLGRMIDVFDEAERLDGNTFIEVAEYIGKHLKGQEIYFDLMVKAFCNKAKSVEVYTDGLKQQIQEAFLKGLDASCKASGIPTTLEPSA